MRYIGVTTSNTSQHPDMERLVETRELDFIQVNYSVGDTVAERRVIPAAAANGVAVMTNRPFGNGRYFNLVAGHVLPDWAAEFDCESWAQFSLKYVLSNPDVTCVVPATSKSKHMADNAGAGYGRLPESDLRERMVRYLYTL